MLGKPRLLRVENPVKKALPPRPGADFGAAHGSAFFGSGTFGPEPLRPLLRKALFLQSLESGLPFGNDLRIHLGPRKTALERFVRGGLISPFT